MTFMERISSSLVQGLLGLIFMLLCPRLLPFACSQLSVSMVPQHVETQNSPGALVCWSLLMEALAELKLTQGRQYVLGPEARSEAI